MSTDKPSDVTYFTGEKTKALCITYAVRSSTCLPSRKLNLQGVQEKGWALSTTSKFHVPLRTVFSQSTNFQEANKLHGGT